MKKIILIPVGFILLIVVIILFGYDKNAQQTKEPFLKTKKILEHVIIEERKYDIPAKSQMTYRLGLYNVDSCSNIQIKELIDEYIKKAKSEIMKYHNPPSHIFIYVYSSEQSFKSGYGNNWIGMFSKTGKSDTGNYSYSQQ